MKTQKPSTESTKHSAQYTKKTDPFEIWKSTMKEHMKTNDQSADDC